MKHSPTWSLVLPVTALLFSACRKNEAPKSAETIVEEVVENVDEAEVIAPVSALSAEERAEMLGIVGHLSADTEAVFAIYDGKGMVESLRSLSAWEFIQSVSEEEMGMDLEDVLEEQGGSEVEPFLGEEFFLAFGESTASQMASLMTLQSRMSYYQFRILSGAMAKGMVEGDIESAIQSSGSDQAWISGMISDIGDFMPQIEGAQVPPVLVGLKVSDAEARGMAEQQLRSMMGMVAEEAEPLDFEKGGASFSGLLFKGADLAKEMEDGREEIDGTIGKENADQIIASIEKKNLAVALGTMEDYLLLYVGGSSEACPLVEDVGDSLAGKDEISFIDGFRSLPVHGFLYGDKDLMAASQGGGLKEMAEGVRDGIGGVDGFGDTRELVALLDMVGEREKALMDLYTPGDLGGVIAIDGGARFELFGGGDAEVIDYDATHQLASLGGGDEVLLFANWVTGSEYEKRAGELMGVIVESAYSLAEKMASMDSGSDDIAEIQEQFQMFDQLFRSDVLKLWDGLSASGEGLGNESALVIDLNGSFPPIPGVPQEVVEGGRFLRASFVSPVEDRSKVGEGWKLIDGSLRGMLKSVSEMGLADINMLVPTNSEKDDIKTWYFDALAFSDDVKPSVTLSDEWFIASTSKNQALDLVVSAGSSQAGAKKGAWIELDLDTARDYLKEAVALVDENGEVIFPDETDLADFREELPRILKGLAALEEFDAITLHDRMDGGKRRVTLHFKIR